VLAAANDASRSSGGATAPAHLITPDAAFLAPVGGAAGGAAREPVVVVGAGPGGLFAALAAAEAGLRVVLLEKGQAVEQRGRDIGALFVRRRLNPESNLCYGGWVRGVQAVVLGRIRSHARASPGVCVPGCGPDSTSPRACSPGAGCDPQIVPSP
jgi:hypothetical protein